MQGSLRLLLVVWLRSSLAAYTNLYIGALINAFNADNGKVNEAGSHQLAAFVMAVNGESMRDFYNTTGNIARKPRVNTYCGNTQF